MRDFVQVLAIIFILFGAFVTIISLVALNRVSAGDSVHILRGFLALVGGLATMMLSGCVYIFADK